MALRTWPNRLALGAVLVFGLLAAGNGLDRASASHPGLVRYVPTPLAAQAHRTAAEAALQSKDNDAAIAAAQRAVAADPLDPRSSALLGAANLAGRHAVRADQAFRVAARLGWRDPLTQLYFMNAALGTRQPRLAAQRLDAVLRQDPDFPLRDMMLAQLSAAPGGSAALTERLALRPAWSASFIRAGVSLPLASLQQRAAILAATPGVQWGCDAIAPLVQRMVTQGGAGSAKALWQAQCERAVPGIADPHFSALQAGPNAVPFEWNLLGDGAVSALPAPDQHGLLIRNSGVTERPVAWQMLVLSPGRYQLDWTATAPVDGGAAGLSLSLSCGFDERHPIDPLPSPRGDRQRAIFQASGDCAAQFLTLWAAPGPGDVRFDNPVLTPLR